MKRAHSTFRLSAETKALLRILASADDATLTAEVTRLIRDEANRRGAADTARRTYEQSPNSQKG